jgi:REP element-mobilizing transposase RayT
MPNHFHFLINTYEGSLIEKKVGGLTLTALNNGFRQFLSAYAQAVNKQEGRSGSLFRQKTKAKLVENEMEDYPFICFQYIHQNPLKSRLVNKMEEWEFSSFQDYLGLRKGTLCNQPLACKLLNISMENFYQESYQVISSEKIKGLL